MPTPDKATLFVQGFNKALGDDPNAPSMWDKLKSLIGGDGGAQAAPVAQASPVAPASPQSALGQLQQGVDTSTLGNPTDPLVQARLNALRKMQQGQ